VGSAFRSDTSRMSAAVRLSSACFVALRFHFWVRATSAFGMEVWPSSWPWTHCVADAGRCEAGDERTTAQPGVGAGGEPVLGVLAKGEAKTGGARTMISLAGVLLFSRLFCAILLTDEIGIVTPRQAAALSRERGRGWAFVRSARGPPHRETATGMRLSG
jgi:hypothetical protein